jgi:hypothetical protein
LLQPRGDVHAISEDIAFVEDDIADIDANSVLALLVFRKRGILVVKGEPLGAP